MLVKVMINGAISYYDGLNSLQSVAYGGSEGLVASIYKHDNRLFTYIEADAKKLKRLVIESERPNCDFITFGLAEENSMDDRFGDMLTLYNVLRDDKQILLFASPQIYKLAAEKLYGSHKITHYAFANESYQRFLESEVSLDDRTGILASIVIKDGITYYRYLEEMLDKLVGECDEQ